MTPDPILQALSDSLAATNALLASFCVPPPVWVMPAAPEAPRLAGPNDPLLPFGPWGLAHYPGNAQLPAPVTGFCRLVPGPGGSPVRVCNGRQTEAGVVVFGVNGGFAGAVTHTPSSVGGRHVFGAGQVSMWPR